MKLSHHDKYTAPQEQNELTKSKLLIKSREENARKSDRVVLLIFQSCGYRFILKKLCATEPLFYEKVKNKSLNDPDFKNNLDTITSS